MLLVGTHSGMAIGKDGVTQMGLEDISLMRSLPNMKVFQPATYNQCRQMLQLIVKESGPSYLRLGRQPVDEIFSDKEEIELGKIQVVEQDKHSEICIVSTGCVLSDVLSAAQKIRKQGYKVTILNVHSIKPFDVETMVDHAKNNKIIVTVEDHSIVGGIGSLVCETLSEHEPKKVIRIGLNDTFPESGLPSELYEKYGLNSESITARVLSDIS
jgi:transketolase